METLDQLDRERRRTKPRKRFNWAKALLKPQTLRLLMTVGKLIELVLRIVYFIGFFGGD